MLSCLAEYLGQGTRLRREPTSRCSPSARRDRLIASNFDPISMGFSVEIEFLKLYSLPSEPGIRLDTGVQILPCIARYEQQIALSWLSLPNIEPSKLCLLYTSPSPRDLSTSRMPSSA